MESPIRNERSNLETSLEIFLKQINAQAYLEQSSLKMFYVTYV
jgi:hypothetical protein